MEEQYVLQILELLHTLQEACLEVYHYAEVGRTIEFQQLCGDMESGLLSILNMVNEIDTSGNKKLIPACQSVLDSVRRIQGLYSNDLRNCLKKIEFELLPLLQEAYAAYYFYQYLAYHPELHKVYFTRERVLLHGNTYIDKAIEEKRYKYEASFIVTAYNKLEYTKQCVKSLLENIPAGLSYELILVNHGSNDGTKEYFERIHPDKQVDIAVNGGGAPAVSRIVEGEFVFWISNDIIITPCAVENLLACIRSDPQIAWAVPTTSNVSNFQTSPAQYSSEKELLEFAERNNRQDPFRWEQRTRLCNPIDIRRSSVWYATSGLEIYSDVIYPLFQGHRSTFPDDRVSLLLRRNGYKMMLVKDAYCHHFGSVTWKPLIQQQGEQEYYLQGRKDFYRAYGVDPWGPGRCFDPVFMERVVGENTGHTEVLGINCGLGSNSLKIKEQIKEHCHNLDVCLTNITSDPSFLEDLKGVSDKVEEIRSFKKFKQFLSKKSYHYIIWEEAFPFQKDQKGDKNVRG